MKTGDKLRRMRMDRGLSQQEVADCLGLDRSTYVKYELGSSIKRHVKDLAKFYNVSTDYLLTDTPYMQAYKPGEVQLPDNLVPIVELVKDLFKDRPEIVKLFTGGRIKEVLSNSKKATKGLSDMTEQEKEHFRSALLLGLKAAGFAL